jgi:hypothetical protein
VKKTERWDRLANTCWLTVPWNRRKMKNDLTTIANKWLAARGLSLGLGGRLVRVCRRQNVDVPVPFHSISYIYKWR